MGSHLPRSSYRWGSWLVALAFVQSALHGQVTEPSTSGSLVQAQANGLLERAGRRLQGEMEFDSALLDFHRAVALWRTSGDEHLADSATLWLGNELLGTSHHDTAKAIMERWLVDLRERHDTADQAGAYGVLGLVYYGQGDFPKAIAAYDRAERFAQATHQMVFAGRNLNNLGLIYKEMARYDQAVRLFERSVEAYLAGGDTIASAIPWTNLAQCAIERKDFARAEELVHAGLRCLKDKDDPRSARNASLLWSALANIQMDTGEPQEAVISAREALRLAEISARVESLLYANLSLGAAYLFSGDHVNARRCAEKAKAMALSHSLGLTAKRDVAQFIVRISERTGPPELALRDLREWVRLKDSVVSGPTQWALEQLALRQLEQLDSLEQVSVRQDLELRHTRELAAERDRRLWWIFALSITVLVAAAAWLRWRVARRNERRLEELNRVILEAQERLLLSEKAREVERVRTRIAGDVHDDIGGELTKITLLANEAKRRLGKDPKDTAIALDRIRGVSKEVGGTLNDIVWAVDPRNDSMMGMMDQVRVLAQRMTDGTGVDLSLDLRVAGGDHALDPATRRDLFLVLKEAMNNALKHAGATRIEVRLHAGADRFELSVKDNGKGFDPHTVEQGNGLASMRARSARLSAVLGFVEVPGGGAEVSVNGRLD